MEVREKRVEENNSNMFRRLASHNPPIYNGTLDPKTFENWIRGIENFFNTQCPEK